MKKQKRILFSLVACIFGAGMFLTSLNASSEQEASPLCILRMGDSITRFAASDASLVSKLNAAGIKHVMMGSQDWNGHLMEGYNGQRIEFFYTLQSKYGGSYQSQPGEEHVDSIPAQRALEAYSPDIILLMVGVNNLGSPDVPTVDVSGLTTKLQTLLDRIRQWAPDAHTIISTVTPADKDYTAWSDMTYRNERHTAFNTQVLVPVVQARIDAGQPFSLVDANAVMDPSTDLSDGVHPNELGKAKINDVWYQGIVDLLGESN